ncbi:hypothetical protein AB0C08_17010, partial [Microbispora bryophytorum]|uniref:hypothetical protein n=1 Tax=Microbispora bryophytorum TaxID=1460882 RepID=UPI0033C69A4A
MLTSPALAGPVLVGSRVARPPIARAGSGKVKVGAPSSGVRGCIGIGIGCRSGCCVGLGDAGVTWPVAALTLSRCGSTGHAHVAGVGVAEVAGVVVAGDGVFDVAVFHPAGTLNASGAAGDAGVLAVPPIPGTGRTLSVPVIPNTGRALGILSVLAVPGALAALRALGALGALAVLRVLVVLAVPAALGAVRALGVLGVLGAVRTLGVLGVFGVVVAGGGGGVFGVVGLGVGGQRFGVDQDQKLSHDLLLHQRDERIHLAHPQRPIIALRTRLGIRIQQRPQPRRRLTR